MRLGAWWTVCLSVITPFVLGYMMIDSIRTDFKAPYSGYSGSFLALGVAIAVLSIVLGWVIAGLKWKRTLEEQKEVS
jgi:NSS family neurotransmitter:Na+ symporter